jgi:hypothetical protein
METKRVEYRTACGFDPHSGMELFELVELAGDPEPWILVGWRIDPEHRWPSFIIYLERGGQWDQFLEHYRQLRRDMDLRPKEESQKI